MRKALIAWWFFYSLTSAQHGDMRLAGPFDGEVACNRMRDDLIGRLGILVSAFISIGFNFAVNECQQDRIDKMPR